MGNQVKIRFLLLCSVLLASCSGGGLESDTNNTDLLVLVNAGLNQSINEGVTYSLTGNASGQTEELTYVWSASPAISISQNDTAVADATFLAPNTSVPITYTFTLRVTDGNGNQGSDSVQIEILPLNELPEAIITLEQYTGFSGNLFPAGVEVVLDGSGSIDVDAADNVSPIASYSWQQTAGDDVLGNVSVSGDKLAFYTPILESASSLSFSLMVTDQEGAEDTQTVVINVQSASETKPIVSAGIDHQVYSGEQIILTGQASSSIPSALPLTYLWLNDSELLPSINAVESLQTYAVAPLVSSQQMVTFTLQVTDSFNNVVLDSITVRVKPLPQQPINDTGVMLQASTTEVGTAYQGEYPGQDGQRGLDIINSNGLLEKAGRGLVGFDYTRLDAIGDEVDNIDEPWRCIRDNHTGLIWEAKTTDSGLHGRLHSYSWQQSGNNGGYAGDINGAGTSCSITNCNTDSYISAVNTQGLCGFYDWRLPNHNELLSIVHFGKTSGPLVDSDYFPNTTNGLAAPVWYWTNTASADGVQNDEAQNAWAIDFASGNDNFLNKSIAARIRLVRAGR